MQELLHVKVVFSNIPGLRDRNLAEACSEHKLGTQEFLAPLDETLISLLKDSQWSLLPLVFCYRHTAKQKECQAAS